MFNSFNTLVKKLSWIDVKLVALAGVCVGILLAKIEWVSNINCWWFVVIGLIAIIKVWSVMLSKKNQI